MNLDDISQAGAGLQPITMSTCSTAPEFGIFEESLAAAVARLFGIDRLRAESAATIDSVIEDLVRRSLLRRNGVQVHLA